MKHFLTLLFTAGGLLVGRAQTAPIYENFGSVTDPPQIDALAFANYGDFSVTTQLPYDFQNTRFFTNRGTMTGSPGFRFANASSGIVPFRTAGTFVNEIGASVEAVTGASFSGGFGTGGVGGGRSSNPSYLLLSATNIINRGTLIANGAGIVQVIGKNVDLSRSGLGIGRLDLSSTHFVTDTNFNPDPGIYDEYWALTNQFDMRVSGLLQITAKATNATSPVHDVTNSPFAFFPTSAQLRLSITNPAFGMVSVYTNSGGADPDTGRITNILKQAVFVAVSDTNLTFDVKWAPSIIVTNPFQTPIIEIKLADTNIVTGNLEFSTLYLRDLLASWTNYTVLTNLATLPAATMRPATFELTRTPPFEFMNAGPGNGTITNNFFYDGKDTNYLSVVTNYYAAYSAQIDSLASRPPNVEGLKIEDYPGRVEIQADNLDLTRTRMKGSGLISIKTPNLTGSRGVNADSENVIYNLSVPSGPLNLQGFAKEKVVRLNGTLSAWSGIWTNFSGTTVTNTIPDPSGTGTTNEVTNVVTEIDTHMLIVDATGLQATKAVTTYDFITHADEVIVSDPISIVRTFLANTTNLTLNSRLSLSAGVSNWASVNSPRLQFLTVKGSVEVQNIADLGHDTAGGYDGLVNRGTIAANGILIRSKSIESSGTIASRVDGITIDTDSGQFQDASTLSEGDIIINATDVRFAASTNSSVRRLILNVTHSLADTGEGANNLFQVGAGFELPVKPEFGDLLGTTIESIGPRYARVEHIWAGEDRGASATGFENNVAIGHLVLGGDTDVLMSFRGATGGNGMYVDLLELTGPLTNAIADGDLSAALVIDPSLTIYFSESNFPADQLEQLSEGRLKHVEFAGSLSFVEVPTRSGNSVEMARGVRESTTVDSDGDGVPNAYDAYPLDSDAPLTLRGIRANGETSIELTWTAKAQTTYQVEFTTNLESPAWQSLSTYINSGSAPQSASVHDRMAGDHAQRLYRVRSSQ